MDDLIFDYNIYETIHILTIIIETLLFSLFDKKFKSELDKPYEKVMKIQENMFTFQCVNRVSKGLSHI